MTGSEVNHIAFGPWGGQSGYHWDDGVFSGVRQVAISTSSLGIHSIQFEYDKNGRPIWSDKHGGNSGTRTDQIKLDYPSQYLVSIGGYCGSITKGGPVIVRSLCLQTNRKRYGPFGIEQGTPFSTPVHDGEMLVGFHGRSSEYLVSIGVFVTQRMLPTGHGRVPGINKKVLSLGPWGGDGGTMFDDGIYTGVREIHITRTGGLVSIRVCYDQNGKVVWGNKHGGTGGLKIRGLKIDKIVFDYPYEILTHITGYYGSTILRGPTVVKSLTFHTNKRDYGPFGDSQGFSFSTGSLGPIVGFHGRNGYFVQSIGVHVLESKPVHPQPYLPKHVFERKPVYFPPLPYAHYHDVPKNVIERKPVYPPPYVDRYDEPEHVIERKPVYPPPYVDHYDEPKHVIERKPVYPPPYVDHYDEPKHVIERKPVYPPPYIDHYDVPKHVIERKPVYPPPPPYADHFNTPEVAWGIPRQPALYDSGQSGPWGGEGGKSWDDGVFTGVKKIILTRGDAICSIQIQYDEHGRSVWSALHGISNDSCTYHLKFDYPYEVLTSISGSYDILVGDMYSRVIRSLTFHTNKAKYGPYGKPIGTQFSSNNNNKEGKIVGFHGRSGTFLDAIGVHMQHWVNDELSRHSPERGGIRNMLHKLYK